MKNVVKKYLCLCLFCLLLAGVALPAFALQKLNLNQATIEQLVELKGIGQKTAEKIIAYRDQHGEFISVDELIEVRGIGDKKMDALRDLVTVSTDMQN